MSDVIRELEKIKKQLNKTAVTEGGSGGSGAPTDAEYLVLTANGSLTGERILTPGNGLTGADAGTGSTYTLSVNVDDATIEINTDTLRVKDGGITSTKLADGAALAEILDDAGAGSGLDADLLDGNHASAFLTVANNLTDVGSAATAFGNIKQAATDAATGVVELATQTEVDTGTDTGRVVTPATNYTHLLNRSVAVQGNWFDHALIDSANASGVASHFRDNTATYPTGWTESDAALATDTNSFYSFWFFQGSNGDPSWKYRRIMTPSIEALTANDWFSVQFGPILFRDGAYTADLDYVFGVYRNNAGAIDEQTYSRVRLHWNSSSAIWQIRGEEKDGTTAHNGTYTTLSVPLTQPLYVRVLVRNLAAKTTRQYVGTSVIPESHTLLQEQAPSSAPTWGTPWVQMELSRGAGVGDFLLLGALDYQGNEP